jgi:hypothetical protein
MEPLLVPITLKEYWYEDISKEEAMKRLDSRNLDPETRAEVEKDIPDHSRHFLTFEPPFFREYLLWDDGVAALVLLLPMKVGVNSFIIQGFVDRAGVSGVGRSEFTIDLQRKLFENGKPVPFTYSDEPAQMNLDASFLVPVPEPERFRCSCRACEWVHSRLNIHWADPLCCLGCCFNLNHRPALVFEQF